jgi:hypothetical protein
MGQWVPVREAAIIMGLSEKTFKRRIAAGQLEAHTEQMEKGLRYLVEVPDVTPDEDSSTPIEAQTGVTLAYQQLVETLQDQVSHLQRELEFKNHEIADFHRLLQQQAEALALPQPAAVDLVPATPTVTPTVMSASPQRDPIKNGFWKRLFGIA